LGELFSVPLWGRRALISAVRPSAPNPRINITLRARPGGVIGMLAAGELGGI
jgi:hypothetical protein